MSEMRMEIRKLADLKPAEYNPRKRLTPDDPEYQELRRSLETLDYSDPIVINSDGTIIKGHQRCYILMDMGRTEAPVVVLDIPDKAKEKALNIALNKITGQWDETKLKEVLISLDLEGYDFSVTGFQRQDLEELIQLADIPPEAKDDDYDPDKEAEQIETPESRPGDIWRLGRHRLLCGDATNPADIARLMDGAKLDLTITDPPYNVDYGEKTKFLETYTGHAGSRRNSDIRNDKMSGQAFHEFLLSAFRNMSEEQKENQAMLLLLLHVDIAYLRPKCLKLGTNGVALYPLHGQKRQLFGRGLQGSLIFLHLRLHVVVLLLNNLQQTVCLHEFFLCTFQLHILMKL